MNPSVFITNTSVLCEVGTEFLYAIYMNVRDNLAVVWIRRLVSGVSPRRHGFDLGPVRLRFMVYKVALEQGFLRVL
jgi:hypothetical protein